MRTNTNSMKLLDMLTKLAVVSGFSFLLKIKRIPRYIGNIFALPAQTVHFNMFKGTNVFSSDFSGLACLLHLYTRLNLLDYRKLWNNGRWKSFE